MDNPIELVTDALQGDIEITGKRIPKIAIIAGGGVLIVILILLSRGRGSGRALSSNGVLGGDSTGVGSSNASGGLGGGTDTGTASSDVQSIQESLVQQLQNQSSSLTDLIAQNSAQQSSDLNAQIGSVYDQLAQVGSSVGGGYDAGYTPIPTDFGYSMPVDSGIQAYPPQVGFDLNTGSPTITTMPVDSSKRRKTINDSIKKLKPLNPKPAVQSTFVPSQREKHGKLGNAPLIDKLKGAPKPNTKPPGYGYLNFNRNPDTVASYIKNPIPIVASPREQHGKLTNAPLNIVKKPVSIPATIKNPLAYGNTQTGKIPQAAQPVQVKQKQMLQPFYGAQPKQINVTKPNPVYNYPKPAPIPIYKPPVPSFTNPFRTLPNYGKVTPKTYKKGK